MKMQLVTATLLMKNGGKNPPVLRPAPFAKGGHWGICRSCSNRGTSFSCAVLYRLAHELLCADVFPEYAAHFFDGIGMTLS